MSQKYSCKNCEWLGLEEELDHDQVETCFGNDEIELCPKCGSIEVILVPLKSLT